jgi:plastocyanin domain-containing protein
VGKETQIAFSRSDAQNCASEVVFPELKIRKPLPPGQTVIIDLPAQPAGEMQFACGMGMFRGALVIR